MGRELPARPTLFAKFADTLTGPADAVPAVAEDPGMDWEGELAVVGRTAYKVREEEADQYIAGFTVANDIPMRGWQYGTTEWLQGKIRARSTPVDLILTGTPGGAGRARSPRRYLRPGDLVEVTPSTVSARCPPRSL
ncbi:fumarylacetoacetate hydrolase family protein [Streptomyces sp. NPDC088337]|uniref:fumarylacetoacetate hydrolase family protein n=2 Tax=Streptomyces TaxID=1883 RepID=UPI002DD8D0B7|nr:fumarylacetoacetate hydrolase family protein [Streptomyces sp. NBC_01788]WSB30734.1 fumarylacetoacetate hydrolase family protein [Streptomyces sp. NBC_01788]